MEKLERLKPIIDALYIVLLAAIFGGVLALGAFVAPVIFRDSAALTGLVDLDRYAAGRIMSEIFRRFSIAIDFSLVLIAAYEAFAFWRNRDAFALAIAAIVVISGGAFALYYTPEVLRLQELGSAGIDTIAFDSLHKQSEAFFKIFMGGVFVLALTRIVKR